MNTLTYRFICQTLGLPERNHDDVIGKVGIDSRSIEAGDVFIALPGERVDGHDFVSEVLAKGAYAIVSREDYADTQGCLKVDDTLIALQTLAAAWRQHLNPLVLGITGSSGKTTVKEMLATVLRHHFGADSVLATMGNLNNHIGLPLTLLNLKPQHRYAVVEMGMNHFGELALLTRIAQPNIALVNNALRAHIGCGFNGVADIARAKSEIYAGLPKNGIAILPAEDQHFAVFQAASLAWQQYTFGVYSGDVHAENCILNPFSCSFELCFHGEKQAVMLPIAGQHNIANACACSALALQVGFGLADIAKGLTGFSTIQGRLQIKSGKAQSTLIDDTYNANPDSMKAALDVLSQLPAPRVFIMGDMGELGEDQSAAIHREIGLYARDKGIEYAYFVGKNSACAAEVFGENGLWFADKDSLIQVLIHQLPEKASILIKGSRFMQMEVVVKALLAEC